MVDIAGHRFHIGVYLCLIANDLDVAYLAVSFIAVQHEEAVLEHRACVNLESLVV